MNGSTIEKRGQQSKTNSESPKSADVDIAAKFDEGTEIDNAIGEAVREAILFHKLMGNPIAEWDEVGKKVVWIQPEDIKV